MDVYQVLKLWSHDCRNRLLSVLPECDDSSNEDADHVTVEIGQDSCSQRSDVSWRGDGLRLAGDWQCRGFTIADKTPCDDMSNVNMLRPRDDDEVVKFGGFSIFQI